MQCGISYGNAGVTPEDSAKQNVVTRTLGVACTAPPKLPSVGAPAAGPPGSLALDMTTGDLLVSDPNSGRYIPVNGRRPYKLLVYYGYPSLLNAIPTLEGVAQAFGIKHTPIKSLL